MSGSNPEERWSAWLVQAERFALKDAFIEARGRARHVCDEIRAAVEATADGPAKVALEGRLARAERAAARYQEQFEAWSETIAARRAATVAGAEDEMKRPLPPGV